MDNPFVLQEQEYYTMGACMFLSAALHVVFGWEIRYYDLLKIEQLADDFQSGDHPFAHTYVRVNGRIVDIMGSDSDDEDLSGCTYPELQYWMTWDVQANVAPFYEALAEAVELVRGHYGYFAQFEKGGK